MTPDHSHAMDAHRPSMRRLQSVSGFDFEDHFDFDGRSGGQGREAQSTASVVAIAILSEDGVQQIGAAVDDEVLIREIRGRVNAAQNLENSQAV